MGTEIERVDRDELRSSIKTMRQQWRESLLPAKLLGSGTKLGKRAGVMWRELDIFEDRIKECGGEDAMMALFCAHMADRGDIEDFCAHYALDAGLLGAFVAEKPERMQWLHNALQWKAEVDVSRTVPLADGATVEDVKVVALQIKARMDRAALYAPERFGKKEGGLAGNLENLADVLTRISERKRAPQTLENVTDVEAVG